MKPLTAPLQIAMFQQGEDLPLFSGTPQDAQEQPFRPVAVTAAPKLPGLDTPPDWQELQNSRRKP